MAAPFCRSFRRSDLNAFYHKLPLRQQGTAQSAGGESRNLVIQCSPKRSKSLILPAFRVFIIPQSPGKMGLCKSPGHIRVGKAHFREGCHNCVSEYTRL